MIENGKEMTHHLVWRHWDDVMLEHFSHLKACEIRVAEIQKQIDDDELNVDGRSILLIIRGTPLTAKPKTVIETISLEDAT